jgi:acetyl-CoA acetyltransferase
VVVASEEAVKKHNLEPLARLVGYSITGVDPTIMGIGPVYAIRDLLARTRIDQQDIDIFEVCEVDIATCL